MIQTFSIEILHPKALKLLQDLAELELISFKKEEKKEQPSTINPLQELLLQGPTWSDDEFDTFKKNRISINKIGKNDTH